MAITATQKSTWTKAQKLDYVSLAASATGVDDANIADADPDLEEQLFHQGNQSRAGESLQALELNVVAEGPNPFKPISNFADADLHPIVRANVSLCKYESPTAIQGHCIPALLQENDIVAVAQTGSGKTAAYLIPIVSKLMGKVEKIGGPRVDTRAENYDPERNRIRAEPLVVIVCPTRELALQIFNETRRISYRSKLLPVCTYGGIPEKHNVQQLSKGCDILIGTPGRLCSLMDKPHVLSMARLKYTILDEADEMLQPDWADEVDKIMSGGDTNQDSDHRYLMFSATFPKMARQLAREYMQQDYVRIRVGRAGSTHRNVKQVVIWVDEDAKKQATLDLLQSMEPGLTIIFCNAVHTVDSVDDFLFNQGKMPTTFMHSQRTQFEREDAMRSFKRSETPILVATGISARGVDFTGVKQVINYDLPGEQGGIDEYVHRIGRTARIGHVGTATSFYNSRNESLGQPLVNLLMENDQDVPDFLAHLKPEDGKVEFADDTDDEVDLLADIQAPAAGGETSSDWNAPAADEAPASNDWEKEAPAAEGAGW